MSYPKLVPMEDAAGLPLRFIVEKFDWGHGNYYYHITDSTSGRQVGISESGFESVKAALTELFPE